MAPHVVQDPANHFCSIPTNYSAGQGLLYPLHTVKKPLTLLPSTMLIKAQPFDLLGGFCRQLIPHLQILLNLTFAVTCKSTHREFARLQPKATRGTLIGFSRDSFTVEDLATSSHTSWSLWTPHVCHKLFIGFWSKNLPSLVLCYVSLEEQLLAAYCVLLETETSTGPVSVTLCTQLPIMP